MHFSSLAIIICIVLQANRAEEFCTIESEDSCGDGSAKEKSLRDLDEKYKNYIHEIRQAEEKFVSCELKNCGCYADAITRDLKPFENGIDLPMIEKSMSRGTLYQLIDGKLYRDEDCMFPSRCAGVEHFILEVAQNLTVDTEFVINTRDYPQSSVHFGEALPIFSFSKTADYFDIMYPAWSFWEGGPAISLYPRGLGRWDKHRNSLKKSADDNPWERKKSKGFFRGSRTSSDRDNLILLSRRRPDLVNANYTKNQAWKSAKDTLNAEPAPEVSLEAHCEYKYLFNYRGVAASFRHKHLFLCGSLVFHVGDEWLEFYYDSLKPWIHFIPVEKDASQEKLENLLNFAKDNDHLAKTIAERGRDWIWRKLRMQDVVCYWRRLLKNYSKLLRYKPTPRSNLVRIS